MKSIFEYLAIGLGVIALIAITFMLLAFPLMWLWNWLMPEIFNLTTLTYWQSLGILLLSSFLFKNPYSRSK